MLPLAIDRVRERRLRVPAAAALLFGIVVLAVPARRSEVGAVSWESLLAPYSQGAPLPGGFRIEAIRRGRGNDVVIAVSRPGETTGVEVHVLERGRWPDERESQSFTIAYETPRSPAAEREAITEVVAETIRSRDRGLPAPDAIPLGASFDAGVLPEWLDVLRGWQGTLLGASLVLLVPTVLVGSRGLSVAGLVLGSTDVVARVVGVPTGNTGGDGGATMFGGAMFVLTAMIGWRWAISRRDVLLGLTITAVALALRLGLGPWGPLHVNGYAPNFVFAAARNPEEVATYGPGYVEVFAPFAARAPSSPDWAIFGTNAVFSALAVTLAFALGRLCGVPPAGAAAAALLLAIDPIAIRMSATESYFTPIVFLCNAAAVALLVATRDLGRGDKWRAPVCIAGAGLLLAQAARIHPAAWVAVSTVPFVVLAAEGRDLRSRSVALVAGGAMIGGLLIATSGGALLDVLGRMRSGTMYRPAPPASFGPLAWTALAAALYALFAPQRWLAVPAALSLAALLMTRGVFWESWIWQQSSWRVYSTIPVVALAGAFSVLLKRRWVASALALAVALAWFRSGLPIVAGRTTDHLEYRWVREQLLAIPPSCPVIHVASVPTRHLVLPTYVRPPSAPAVAIDQQNPRTVDEALIPWGCAYYVHTSLCSSTEGRPMCDAIESKLALVPIARALFPARPSRDRIPYDTDPIETFIAQVERVNGAATGR